MLGLTYAIPVEHKPKLLCLWLASDHSTEMEKIPDELLKNQTIGLVNRFFGRDYNITLPKEIRRYNINIKNFNLFIFGQTFFIFNPN